MAIAPRLKMASLNLGLALLVSVGTGACGGSADKAGGSGSSDVKIDKCEWLPSQQAVAQSLTDRPRAVLTVTNHTSAARDYLLTVAFDSADGKTQYDTADASIDTLEVGQSGSAIAISFGSRPGPLSRDGHGPGGDSGPPIPISCKVVKVDHRHF